jgi:hypothetical protein
MVAPLRLDEDKFIKNFKLIRIMPPRALTSGVRGHVG